MQCKSVWVSACCPYSMYLRDLNQRFLFLPLDELILCCWSVQAKVPRKRERAARDAPAIAYWRNWPPISSSTSLWPHPIIHPINLSGTLHRYLHCLYNCRWNYVIVKPPSANSLNWLVWFVIYGIVKLLKNVQFFWANNNGSTQLNKIKIDMEHLTNMCLGN